MIFVISTLYRCEFTDRFTGGTNQLSAAELFPAQSIFYNSDSSSNNNHTNLSFVDPMIFTSIFENNLLLLVLLLLIGIFVVLSIYYLWVTNVQLRESQKELLLSDARWQKAEKIASIGYYEYSLRTGELIWSDSMYDLFGINKSEKEPTFTEYFETIHDEDKEDVKRVFNDAITSGTYFDIEYRIKLIDKNQYLRTNGEAVRNKDGKIIKLFGTIKDITEEKKTQFRIEQSEERFRLLSNLTFEGIILHKNGIMLDSNQSFLSMFGYTRDELIGKNVVEIVALPEYIDLIKEKASQKQPAPYEIVGITKEGIKIPIEIESREIIYEGQNARVAALRNISERKKQEDILAREQWLFTTLMNNIPDSIYFKDLQSRFIRVNEGMLKKHYISNANEIIGKTDFDIFDEEHAKPAFEDEQKIIETGVPMIGKIEKEVWNDRHITWGLTSKLPFYDQYGEIQGTFGITRNITDLKNAQNKIQEEKEKFELLFRIVPSAIFTVDNNEIITSWNSMAEELTGFSAVEVIGKTCNVFSGKPCSEACGLFDPGIEKPMINQECIIVRKDGTTITVSKNIDYMRDKDGNIVGGIESFIDISDRKKHEEEFRIYSEELKELNASKDRFFSIIAHDLRNPFITLLGFTEMLVEDYEEFSDKEKVEYLREMEKTSRSSYELLENLLQWSRSQTGRIKYDPEKMNFKYILSTNIDLLNKSSEFKNISIKDNIDEDCYVYADSDMVTTILRNLLTNSLKFTERGGEISINSADYGDHILFGVKDSGVGMNDEQAKNLFQMDTSNSSVGTEGERGSGLGLLLCKEFVEKHNGKIWAESILGKGSTFYFTLPKAK